MKRLFWFGIGAVAGAVATTRIAVLARSVGTVGFGENVAEGLREIGAGIGSFGAEVRAGMDARERELTDLARRAGGGLGVPTFAEALAEPESSYPAAGRARPAGR